MPDKNRRSSGVTERRDATEAALETNDRLSALERDVKHIAAKHELEVQGLKLSIERLLSAIKENTELTNAALTVARRVESSTGGVVMAFDSAKGGLKVLGVLGKAAAALSAMISLATAAWLIFTRWFTK